MVILSPSSVVHLNVDFSPVTVTVALSPTFSSSSVSEMEMSVAVTLVLPPEEPVDDEPVWSTRFSTTSI